MVAGRQAALWDVAPQVQRPQVKGVTDPVARVLLDVNVAHLDHPFDYLVPARLDAAAQPGRRVRVRLGGKLVTAWVLERRADTDHTGSLRPLSQVLDRTPVLHRSTYRIARALARDWVGTTAQVLAQALPPVHARVQRAFLDEDHPQPVFPLQRSRPQTWANVAAGPEFVTALGRGESPWAVWTTAVGQCDPSPRPQLVEAVRACLAARRRALVLAPTRALAEDLSASLQAGLGQDEDVTLMHSGMGRDRRYLASLRAGAGLTRVVVGTRSAALTYMPETGLVVCWDEGDPLYREQLTPYVPTLAMLVQRCRIEGSALLAASPGRSAQAQALVQSGEAVSLVCPRQVSRARGPLVHVASREGFDRWGSAGVGRIPARAQQLLRAALADGPVLVNVPRTGYVPVVACARCGAQVRCATCGGAVRLGRDGRAACAWCGARGDAVACPDCPGAGYRAVRVGSERTAEELGRAFPGVPVVSSTSAAGTLRRLSGRPRLVVATPKAVPRVAGGYAAALIVDAQVVLAGPGLDVQLQALRDWLGVAALMRPGAPLVVLGHVGQELAQALVRCDPVGFAARTLAERAAVGFPPAVKMVAISGAEDAVTHFCDALDLPAGATVLGPAPWRDGVRALVRCSLAAAPALLHQLRRVRQERGVRGLVPVSITVDSPNL